MKIIFDQPAKDFMEALPIGNGRLGAMIYGETLREQVILNESSMWSGSLEETDRFDAKNYLGEIRELLRNNKNYEAQQLFASHFTCKGKGSNYAHGSTVPFGCYQVLGRLHLSYFQAVSMGRRSSDCFGNYSRILDLDTGRVSTKFQLGDSKYQREWLASKDQEALYAHLTASQGEKINLSIGIDRDERFQVESENNILLMTGQLNDGQNGCQGIQYACAVGAVTKGGTFYAEGNRIYIEDAQEVMLIVTARTNMSGFFGREKIDERQQAQKDLVLASKKTWEEVCEEHKEWYDAKYQSMELILGQNSSLNENIIPTWKRIKRFLEGEQDSSLIALYVQYARYLLITSSNQDGLPSNLQGIWADEIQTSWNGDWHLNAQQMIYWIAEKAGLSKEHIPYLKLTKELVNPGRKTAQAYYGARGWLVHTCTNPWGFTSPCEDAAWGSTTGSPAWQCHHLWEHYLYTMDDSYLSHAYPIMKEAAEFYLDMLVEDVEKGWLVTSPSSSPENSFLDDEGRLCSLCEGPSYDRQLIYALFSYCIEAQYVLQDDLRFQNKLIEIKDRLAPVEVGFDGRIMEWGRDYKEAMPYHRHLSHLWGLYPGDIITVQNTPELAKASLKSLRGRGNSTVGWAIAYRMCLWARLKHAEKAYDCIKDMFRYATAHNMFNLAYHCDETVMDPELPDLENSRYPFQIDGNQGNAAGILLMLLDDRGNVLPDGKMEIQLELLPALPKELMDGEVKGLRTKGGLTVAMRWKNSKLIKVKIAGTSGQMLKVYYKDKSIETTIENGYCDCEELLK